MRLGPALHKELHQSMPEMNICDCICQRLPAVPDKRRLPGVSHSMDLTV